MNKVCNRTKQKNYSYDLINKNNSDNDYTNQTVNNNNTQNYNKKRKEKTKLNNGIRKYISKTNDVINQRMIVTEPKLNEERDNNSFIVNSTDLNNYKFDVS